MNISFFKIKLIKLYANRLRLNSGNLFFTKL